MTYDPVHLSQRLLWGAAHLRRRDSGDTTRLDGMDEEARERFFKRGSKQIDTLAARMEAQTGFTLESRTALDFGCGVGRNTLALAERCGYVYGLDVSPAVLREADRNASLRNLKNVEWMDAGRLGELHGRYDLVISFYVFQHIPTREGERIIDTLVRGLRPGGAGAIHLTLPPKVRRLDRSYLYSRMNAYSLSRVGKVLADASVTEWHAKLHARPVPGTTERAYDEATLIFRKD